MCLLALSSPAVCAEPLEVISDTPDSPWQYASDGEEWLSPATDEAVPPCGFFDSLRPRHWLRNRQWGQPLHGTSWLNRPYYVGAFGGTWLGETLISGEVDQGSGFMGGYWLGTDLNHHWGFELRASLFYVNTSLLEHDGLRGKESRNLVADANLLYYPWGDNRWRPYGSLGLGVGGFHFENSDHVAVNHTGLLLPVGLGVKYLCHHWLAFRLDIKDNIVFGDNGVGATNNWSFLGGVEVHWGGNSSAQYLPW